MKYYISLLLSILIFTFAGCSKDLSTSPPNEAVQGGLSLKIDKTSSPKNVMKVIAYLNRADYDTYTGELNLLSDTSADISFKSIPVGTWHLKVDALDSDGVIVYSGETEVDVNAGITTQVNLTLMPTELGTGSIEITVNWGQTIKHWVDYKNNPVFNANQIPYFTYYVAQAQVMYDNGIYKMWFMNLYDNGHADISYAESNDGISWHLGSNGPVLTSGSPGTWDDYTVAMGYVLKVNGIYRLYYIGTRDSHTGNRQIGLATSTDGIHWEKYNDPIIQSDNINQYFMDVHGVIKYNGNYFMYYDASPQNNYTNFNINMATSTDGIHWKKYGNNPILTKDRAWESDGVSYCSVVKDSAGFKMSYGNVPYSAVGMAYSEDGIHWTKDASNPVFNLSDVSQNWCSEICYPYLFLNGNTLRIYYSGKGSDGMYHLGFAEWQ